MHGLNYLFKAISLFLWCDRYFWAVDVEALQYIQSWTSAMDTEKFHCIGFFALQPNLFFFFLFFLFVFHAQLLLVMF